MANVTVWSGSWPKTSHECRSVQRVVCWRHSARFHSRHAQARTHLYGDRRRSMTQYSARVVWQPLINTSSADACVTRTRDSGTSVGIARNSAFRVRTWCLPAWHSLPASRMEVQASCDDLFVQCARVWLGTRFLEHYLSSSSFMFVLPLSDRTLSDSRLPGRTR